MMEFKLAIKHFALSEDYSTENICFVRINEWFNLVSFVEINSYEHQKKIMRKCQASEVKENNFLLRFQMETFNIPSVSNVREEMIKQTTISKFSSRGFKKIRRR